MEKKQKKFNVLLFIVLLLFCFPAGIIYAIVKASGASKEKKGNVKNDGFTAKMVCAIVALLNSIVLTVVGGGAFGIIAIVLSALLVVFAVLSKKTGKSKLFNLLYLGCLILVESLVIAFSALFQLLLLIIISPMIICSIFGLVGVIKGLKA